MSHVNGIKANEEFKWFNSNTKWTEKNQKPFVKDVTDKIKKQTTIKITRLNLKQKLFAHGSMWTQCTNVCDSLNTPDYLELKRQDVSSVQ